MDDLKGLEKELYNEGFLGKIKGRAKKSLSAAMLAGALVLGANHVQGQIEIYK